MMIIMSLAGSRHLTFTHGADFKHTNTQDAYFQKSAFFAVWR